MGAETDTLWAVVPEGAADGWVTRAPTALAASRARYPGVGGIVAVWRLGNFPTRYVRAGEQMVELADKARFDITPEVTS